MPPKKKRRRKARFPETIILRMPKGTKKRVDQAGSGRVTRSGYARDVLLNHLDAVEAISIPLPRKN